MFNIIDLLPQLLRKLIFIVLLREYNFSSYLGYKLYIRYPSRLSIGKNVSINRGCSFYLSYYLKNVEINIKDNVAIGPNVSFLSAGHDINTLTLEDTASSIIVNSNAWIGSGAIILQGVEIGEGAVVAAGAVVTKNVEPWTVVGGNPARKIKNRIIKDELL